MRKLILKIITQSDNPISLENIKSEIFKLKNKYMERSTVQLYLTDLIARGDITRKRIRKLQHTSFGKGYTRLYLYEAA